jgi:putative transposase
MTRAGSGAAEHEATTTRAGRTPEMPRTSRHQLVVAGHPHHLVLRANNRRNLFSCAHDRVQFLRFVLGAEDRGTVHALAMMTNHVHMLVVPTSFDGLWRWVKTFAQRYAMHRNRERGSTGKVFEQRYGLKAILSERHLAATTAYIDLNPARAGIAPTWSTFGLHAGQGRVSELVRELWTPSAWWSSLGRDDASRHAAYRELALERAAAWASDVVLPDGPRPQVVAYARRPVRPDGTRVAEAAAPYPSRHSARRKPVFSGTCEGESDP